MSDRSEAMRQLEEKIKQVRMTPGADNKPVLAVNIANLQTAKNAGYPKHMHHATLDPVMALNDKEEAVYMQAGYYPNYRPREFPKWKYRRNTDEKFALAKADVEHVQKVGGVLPEPFIEAVQVDSKDAEMALLKRPKPATAGPWVDAVTDIEPLPDGPAEDPEVTIARLQGQLEEAHRKRELVGAKG